MVESSQVEFSNLNAHAARNCNSNRRSVRKLIIIESAVISEDRGRMIILKNWKSKQVKYG